MPSLPCEYIDNMKAMLGDEYNAYVSSFSETPCHGLRVNTSRISAGELVSRLPFELERIDFTQKGFYYTDDYKPAKHPYFNAGLYYLQEPSAMLPSDRLPIEEGDYVLDLCAAPGGKSTALLDKLNGTGFLLANDLSASRAAILLSNLEKLGYSNYCVTAENPKKLEKCYPSYFDKILVDAPCSGEGMFRKDSSLISDWVKRGPAYYSPIQYEIMESAVKMLRPGGMLMYSTCTFSIDEDEAVIKRILENYPQMETCSINSSPGFAGGYLGVDATRIFPHRVRGEGHFLALLTKRDSTDEERCEYNDYLKIDEQSDKSLNENSSFSDFALSHVGGRCNTRILKSDNVLYTMPRGLENHIRKGLRYLRTGCLMGEYDKHMKFEPYQAYAMTLGPDKYDNTLNLSRDDDRVSRYLRGETILLEGDEGINDGYVLVCVDSYPLGWCKKTGGNTLKNKYKKAWITT